MSSVKIYLLHLFDHPHLEETRAIIALVAILLLLAFAAHEGRNGFPSLAIVLGVFALIACVVYGARILGIN
jgi:hypothetical protein